MEGGVVIEYHQSKWEELDLDEITKQTKRVFELEGRGKYSLEQIERHLVTLNDRFPFEAVFVAYQEGVLRGWIGIERQTENIGEIGRWHPYVSDVPERDEIAKSLVSETMHYAQENDMNRLEISFGSITKDVMEAYNNRQSWLKTLDWVLVEDTLFMVKEASEEIPSVLIPKDYKLEPLLETEDDDLYSCHYAAFTTSEAREFYGLSEYERRQHFDKLYDRTQPINNRASFALKKDNLVVGILLVVSRENEEYISVVAVRPDFRGLGLAKAMLAKSMNEIREQGPSIVSIGVDTVNVPAINLYKQIGFEVRSRLSFHSWNVEP